MTRKANMASLDDRDPSTLDRDTDTLIDQSAAKRGRRDYREVEFRIIPPHGNDGRSASFSYTGPPKYKRLIELLYSDPRTPWKTESDVLRAFMDYGAHYFGAAIGGKVITGVLHSLGMMNELISTARETNDFISSIDQLDREVGRLVEGGMRESAVGLVYHYREQARQMPDKILRRKITRDIDQRFGYLLKGNQGRKEGERNGMRAIDVDAEARRGDDDED